MSIPSGISKVLQDKYRSAEVGVPLTPASIDRAMRRIQSAPEFMPPIIIGNPVRLEHGVHRVDYRRESTVLFLNLPFLFGERQPSPQELRRMKYWRQQCWRKHSKRFWEYFDGQETDPHLAPEGERELRNYKRWRLARDRFTELVLPYLPESFKYQKVNPS